MRDRKEALALALRAARQAVLDLESSQVLLVTLKVETDIGAADAKIVAVEAELREKLEWTLRGLAHASGATAEVLDA